MVRPAALAAIVLLAAVPLAACKLIQPPQLPPAGKAMTKAQDDACIASGGVWSTENSKSRVCIHYTTDSRKSCTRSSQCQSACLAKSNSCAPIRPLLGCQDILTDSGMRMTQCVN